MSKKAPRFGVLNLRQNGFIMDSLDRRIVSGRGGTSEFLSTTLIQTKLVRATPVNHLPEFGVSPISHVFGIFNIQAQARFSQSRLGLAPKVCDFYDNALF